MSKLKLVREDFFTPTWRRLAAHLGDRLQSLRELNDRHVDIDETSAIRGSIAEIKKLLALAQPSASDAVTPGDMTGDDELG